MVDLRDDKTKEIDEMMDRIGALVQARPDFTQTDLPVLLVSEQEDGTTMAAVAYFTAEHTDALEAIKALEKKLHAAIPQVPEHEQDTLPTHEDLAELPDVQDNSDLH